MKKQYSKVIKIVIQILFFLWIPESFAASLYAVKKLIHAVSVMDFTYAREPVLLLLETVVICQSAVPAERKFQQRESDFCRCLDLYHCSGHIGSIFQSVLQISVSDGSNLYTAFLFLFGQKKAKLQKQRRLFNLSVSVQTAEK